MHARIYTVLHERKHQQEENESEPLTVDEAIEELTHYLLPGGDGVWKQMVYQLPLQRDLYNMFNQNGGTKQRTDMEHQLDKNSEEGTIQPPETAVEILTMQRYQFNTKK